jgi:dephospho-CoA kinase
MRWIGLTGGIASGKSTVAELLRKRGFSVVDADKLAHEVIEPGTEAYTKVLNEFGSVILGPDNRIDRGRLGQIVFGDKTKLAKLEGFIHPAVQQATEEKRRALAAAGTLMAFYDVPLLFEKNLEGRFDGVLLVTCSEETQRARLRSRNKLTDIEIQRRLDAQIPLKEKEKRAQWVIENVGSLKELEKKVDALISEMAHQA